MKCARSASAVVRQPVKCEKWAQTVGEEWFVGIHMWGQLQVGNDVRAAVLGDILHLRTPGCAGR